MCNENKVRLWPRRSLSSDFPSREVPLLAYFASNRVSFAIVVSTKYSGYRTFTSSKPEMRATNHWPDIAERGFYCFNSFTLTVIVRLSGQCQKLWHIVRKVCLIWTKRVRLLLLKQAGSSGGIRLTRNPRSTLTSLVSSTATFSLSSIEFRLVTNKTFKLAENFSDDDSYDSYVSEPEISVHRAPHAISSFRSILSLMLPRVALKTALPEELESTLKS